MAAAQGEGTMKWQSVQVNRGSDKILTSTVACPCVAHTTCSGAACSLAEYGTAQTARTLEERVGTLTADEVADAQAVEASALLLEEGMICVLHPEGPDTAHVGYFLFRFAETMAYVQKTVETGSKKKKKKKMIVESDSLGRELVEGALILKGEFFEMDKKLKGGKGVVYKQCTLADDALHIVHADLVFASDVSNELGDATDGRRIVTTRLHTKLTAAKDSDTRARGTAP